MGQNQKKQLSSTGSPPEFPEKTPPLASRISSLSCSGLGEEVLRWKMNPKQASFKPRGQKESYLGADVKKFD